MDQFMGAPSPSYPLLSPQWTCMYGVDIVGGLLFSAIETYELKHAMLSVKKLYRDFLPKCEISEFKALMGKSLVNLSFPSFFFFNQS